MATSPPERTLAAQPPISRRLPPPCWSHDETVALIDAYRDKWYSLRRGNLRATHWQEVADGVAARCPLGDPPKTSIQCRHKMEKLRKRYRAEIQRIGNSNRYPSSWVHFKLMDSMELGFSSSDPSVDPSNQEEDDEDELMLYPKGIKQAIALPLNRRYQGSIANGVRIKIPNSAAVQPASLDPRYGSGTGSRDGYERDIIGGEKDRNHHGGGGGMKREYVKSNDGDVMDEMVAAIQKLGDGFVKMERMKMDMARELESMRMKMEIKRTQIILESQQKLVDSFSKTVVEKKNKKMKRMPTPES